jgi:multiple sugar transport system ATP-binding protein
MVFQSYALYPHMSVYENIAFPLRVERLPKAEVDERVGRAAKVLQLDARLQQKPGTLSGGQRQRVAIGRAIVRQPKIFLFDEPLSNLDAALRSEMRIELMELHKKLGTTMIYVTHDQVEAMTMADKIVVLNAGRIEQIGGPLELYNRPRNLFVAEFIGSPKMNIVKGKVTNADQNTLTVDMGTFGTITLDRPGRTDLIGQEVSVGMRPEHLSLDRGAFKVTITPTIVERLGIHVVAYWPQPGGENFIALFEGNPTLEEGAAVQVGIDPSQCHIFDAEGIAVLPPA